MTLGFLDFLSGLEFLRAAEDTIDLVEDRRMAEEMFKAYDHSNFDQLHGLLGELREASHPPDPALAPARTRFEKRYSMVADEVGLEHGQAIMWKVNAHLATRGRAALHGGVALEGAGGHGMFLPHFSVTFDEVVFLDCLLVHLLLAKKMAEERHLGNVSFIRADITALPFQDDSFDFIHENGVVEHVAHPEEMVREALRVRKPSGTFVCLSPNRYSLAREPHFLLPAFGFIPRRLRTRLLPRVRGIRSEAGTDLRSLRQLRGYFALAGSKTVPIFFLPTRLPAIARSTRLRRTLLTLLNHRLVGGLVGWLINGPLLPVMPYHVAVATGPAKGSSTT